MISFLRPRRLENTSHYVNPGTCVNFQSSFQRLLYQKSIFLLNKEGCHTLLLVVVRIQVWCKCRTCKCYAFLKLNYLTLAYSFDLLGTKEVEVFKKVDLIKKYF